MHVDVITYGEKLVRCVHWLERAHGRKVSYVGTHQCVVRQVMSCTRGTIRQLGNLGLLAFPSIFYFLCKAIYSPKKVNKRIYQKLYTQISLFFVSLPHKFCVSVVSEPQILMASPTPSFTMRSQKPSHDMSLASIKWRLPYKQCSSSYRPYASFGAHIHTHILLTPNPDHHHSHLRLPFPTFASEDPTSWIYKVDQ